MKNQDNRIYTQAKLLDQTCKRSYQELPAKDD